jgi:glycosyltransferase involved in cell wall biosynthesis
MKILLVTMYFPPAGGAGVQRPLKLAEYLPEHGFETHVLAPDDPKWVHRDDSLALPSKATVHRARNLGPPARRPRGELFGRSGLDRAAFQARLVFRRMLVPDASVLWNLTSIPAAIRIIREQGIDVVVTTSPPVSVNLVGVAAKRLTGVSWVADLRDSVASHAQRVRHIRGERRLARLVARRADAVVTVSRGIAEEMRELGPPARLEVIPNGCDFDDVPDVAYEPGGQLRITHTGSFFGRHDPRPFLQALARSPDDVVARFVGDLRPDDRAYAEELGLGGRIELVPFVPRQRALALQRDSDILLLHLPEAGAPGRAVLSAKVFEYLAAQRPILAAVPTDGEAAELLRETGAGVVVAPDDVDGIAGAIADLRARWQAGDLNGSPLDDGTKQRLSRRARVAEFAALLRSLG